MKKFVLVIILVLKIFMIDACANEVSESTDIIDEYARMYGETIAEGTDKAATGDIEKIIPGFDVEELLSEFAKGETNFSISRILERGLNLFLGEIKNTIRLLILIMAIAILCTYLTEMQNSLQGHEATNAAFFVCYLVIAGTVAAALMETVGCGKALVDNVSVFMRMIVPVILVSLVSSGAPVSASAFETVMMGIIQIAQWIIESFFIPILMMSAALCIVNNLSESINAEKLVQFMNKTAKWGIGIVMTVFVGVMNLQGIVSGGADMLAVKVTKFATSNLIPVVGGALSETVETVINCGAAIKNSVGILGIVIVVLMSAIPIFKIAACLIVFRLSAAVLQPIADKRIVKCISDVADSVSGVFGLVVTVTVMFVIMLTIVINIGKPF